MGNQSAAIGQNNMNTENTMTIEEPEASTEVFPGDANGLELLSAVYRAAGLTPARALVAAQADLECLGLTEPVAA